MEQQGAPAALRAFLEPHGAQVPALAAADLVVELEDFLRPGATETFAQRFRASGDRLLMGGAPRDLAAYPSVQALPAEQRAVAVNEFRNDPMRWALLTPKGAV